MTKASEEAIAFPMDVKKHFCFLKAPHRQRSPPVTDVEKLL
ncbi:hypothetical protein [Nostoc sp. ChiQUE01b]|nr:hypothetical protein [Nostoc sp. ChiQUE01b]MDZ8259887.1 hypothetical protein [Nostoc sp. ChiQUE01b]